VEASQWRTVPCGAPPPAVRYLGMDGGEANGTEIISVPWRCRHHLYLAAAITRRGPNVWHIIVYFARNRSLTLSTTRSIGDAHECATVLEPQNDRYRQSQHCRFSGPAERPLSG
jgi:hypothetical protein